MLLKFEFHESLRMINILLHRDLINIVVETPCHFVQQVNQQAAVLIHSAIERFAVSRVRIQMVDVQAPRIQYLMRIAVAADHPIMLAMTWY